MFQVEQARSATLAVVVGLSLVGVPATALAETATAGDVSRVAEVTTEVASDPQVTTVEEPAASTVSDASASVTATVPAGDSQKAATTDSASVPEAVREDSAKTAAGASDALKIEVPTASDDGPKSSQSSDSKADQPETSDSSLANANTDEKSDADATSTATASANGSSSAGDSGAETAASSENGTSNATSTSSASSAIADEAPAAGLSVDAHVDGKGWLSPVSEGEVAGTTGESRRMEAVTISIVASDGSAYTNDDITYRAHVEGYGWQDWVTGGQVAGTTGQSRRMEALQVALRKGSDLAAAYELWYRAHVEGLGWLAWTSEGPVGSTGHGLRLEAIEVELIKGGSAAPGDGAGTAFLDGTRVELQAHVQNIGWQGWTSESGQVAGTTGEGLRLEALRARVGNAYVDGSVELQTHVQNLGWQGWTSEGQIAGTTGEGLRVEAVRVRLTGGLSSLYDVWYRAHVQQFGWMAWTKNGEAAGTKGASGRMEALQVVLVTKGGTAPSADGEGTTFSFVELEPVAYEAHVSGLGWMGEVSDGALAGTTGQSRQIEAIRVRLGSGTNAMPGGVEYRAHVAGDGWLNWVSNDAVAGTTGQSRRLEAFQARLTGEIAKYFDVWYQAHVADIGWLGWAKDGQTAGSTGLSRAVEAIRVRLVLKGNEAPGSTSTPSVDQSYYFGYQTPGNYYKVGIRRVNVGGGGIFSYSSPVAISNFATRQDCIEAFVARALDYVGTTPYVWDYSCAPGVGVDCAGLVMQALYATGMDLGPHYTPYRHYYVPGNDHYANDMAGDGRFARVSSAQRGDLVFTTGHVAIYLGNGRIVEAYSPRVGVRITNLYFAPTVIRRPFV